MVQWPFTVTSPRHTCVLIMLFNQPLDMSHLLCGWIILAGRGAHYQGFNLICEQILREIRFFVLRKLQLMKTGARTVFVLYFYLSLRPNLSVPLKALSPEPSKT